MIWNWQQADWLYFRYEKSLLDDLETRFLRSSGFLLGACQSMNDDEKNLLVVDIITNEAIKTSEIEGEYLNRDSIQSSIRRKFGLSVDNRKIPPAEHGIAGMMVDLYQNFSTTLSHETLFYWHKMLTNGRHDLNDMGRYRTHEEPMQVISGRIDNPKIHFEAPPSKIVTQEMDRFIAWFNDTAPGGKSPLSALIRSAIAHLYFVSIHPFEDGNGRMARAVAEKSLSQSLGAPTLIALAHAIERQKKNYYDILEKSNRPNEITAYLLYFGNTVLDAQAYTQKMVNFLIEKAKFYDKVKTLLNPRQEKVIGRIFREGLEGFTGGLSADKYIRLTGTSRATATRDLHDLVEKNALIRVGEHRSTRYFLNIPSNSAKTPAPITPTT